MDRSLIIKGGWLQGVELNHSPSGSIPECDWFTFCAPPGDSLPPVGRPRASCQTGREPVFPSFCQGLPFPPAFEGHTLVAC